MLFPFLNTASKSFFLVNLCGLGNTIANMKLTLNRQLLSSLNPSSLDNLPALLGLLAH